MAVSLVSTVGSSSANSYASLAEADAYFENLLTYSQWDGLADDDTRKRALISATAALEQLSFWGVPATTTQALKFPRIFVGASDGTTIPPAIISACCEHALALALAAAAGQTGESERQQMRAEGVLSWSMGNRSESLAPLSSGSIESSMAQFSGPVQRLIQGWVRGAFATDSGRRPVYPNGNYDRNGHWWPTELI